MSKALPRLGAGLGYRTALHQDIVANADRIDFLEVISDQYLYAPPEKLLRLLELGDAFPLIPHGVGLSVGTAAPLDGDYLDRLAQFVEATRGHWFSDHLSFTRTPDVDVEQLTPVWFTEESLEAVCRNVRQLKARIPEPPFLLENVTYYFPIPDNDLSEAEFITRVLEETDTGLLVDVNNVWINSVNLGFDPYEFLNSIPLDRVVQMHIAGGVELAGMLVDTHSSAVNEQVWALAAHVVERAPVKAILLEWDSDWPEFAELLDHLDRARDLLPAPAKAGS
ncbi:DUF692 domain-containing protein [Micromonospora sp. WMMD1128]|uniref:DUF692 domain-containing protein n=1 Tax=unclassified Micromonospora TaxID=2617518 RepID=UPI00248B25D6|nr:MULTISPECIES: DUF692 domain-containing protein [unclassified Micromonospora]WBB73011.1 DUF692 domain-containing protein [Micromonospora sp. WMMD1128]WFE33541.1 DUF692 domain-containing protein [Micromonospora sp. WMMD975]